MTRQRDDKPEVHVGGHASDSAAVPATWQTAPVKLRHPPAQGASGASNYGNYLFGRTYEDPTLPASDNKPNWSSYTTGRILIRLFSRGIMGASFYTLGVSMIRNQLHGYDPTVPMAELGGYTQYPLRYIARFFDQAYGTPIKAFVQTVARGTEAEKIAAAERAVTFRDTVNYYKATPDKMGRSIGHEVVAMTFDFGMGSIGDAWGRRISNLFDPNIHNDWYEDGHFRLSLFAKDTAGAAWTILTKNQGEDWAAALPYIYQMRWQRAAINKLYPGFIYGSDRSHNGAGWLLDDKGRIAQSYSKAGALDLQLRFTGYNWYTLMFREGYDALGSKLSQWWDEKRLPEISLPEHPISDTFNASAELCRYVIKSGIKAGIYMTPAVPFFWAFRTPQSKYRGIGVHLDAQGNAQIPMMPSGKAFSAFDWHDPVSGLQAGDDIRFNNLGTPLSQSDLSRSFDPHLPHHARGAFDKALRPIGAMNEKYTSLVERTVNAMGYTNLSQRARMNVYEWANASMSYTPYMIMKAETALRWDRKPMDEAINRFIDGVFSLNLGKIKGGLSDIREQVIHPSSNLKIEQQEQAARQRYEVQLSDPATIAPALANTPPSSTLAAGAMNRELQERFLRDMAPPSGASIH